MRDHVKLIIMTTKRHEETSQNLFVHEQELNLNYMIISKLIQLIENI